MFKFLFYSSLLYLSSFSFASEIVFDVHEECFKIKGVFYHYDKKNLNFPIELGDEFEVVSETSENLHEGGLIKTITLVSPINGQMQSFQSIVLNQATENQIVEVEKINQVIDKETLTKIYQSFGGNPPLGREVPVWVFKCQYRIILDDGTSYDVHLKIKTFHEQESSEFLDKQWIQAGDTVIWGNDSHPNEINNNVSQYKYFSCQIKHSGWKVEFKTSENFGGNRYYFWDYDPIIVIGAKRNEDTNGDIFTAYYVGDYKLPIRLDKFGTDLNFLYKIDLEGDEDKFGNIIIENNKSLTYRGFKYENGKRVYIFTGPTTAGLCPMRTCYLTPN